ncbi:MAG: hypothetical protein Q8P44_03130, partial [Dehalococcoidia bacterium]|nr:hypothetical protein [Dehalococcoidia bacterium]
TWSTTGNMTYIRYAHTATLLNTGKVLVVGTQKTNGGQTIPEIYDPSTNTWSTATGFLTYGRNLHTANLLPSGKVLIMGTLDADASPDNGLTIPELYTPAGDIQVSNDGSPVNGMGLPRPEQPNNGKGILGEQRNPTLAIDSSNNAVVAWEDTRFAAMQNWGLSFNYDSDAWRQTNVNLGASNACNGGGGTNNSCGAIPLIQNNPLRVMGQMLNSSGVKQWGDDVSGVNQNNPQDLGLASTGDFSANPAIAPDGANTVLTWESNGRKESNGNARNYDIYGQKFDANGASQWGGTWATTAPATYARYNHTATLLNNGKILVTGTGFDNGGRSIAEL